LDEGIVGDHRAIRLEVGFDDGDGRGGGLFSDSVWGISGISFRRRRYRRGRDAGSARGRIEELLFDVGSDDCGVSISGTGGVEVERGDSPSGRRRRRRDGALHPAGRRNGGISLSGHPLLVRPQGLRRPGVLRTAVSEPRSQRQFGAERTAHDNEFGEAERKAQRVERAERDAEPGPFGGAQRESQRNADGVGGAGVFGIEFGVGFGGVRGGERWGRGGIVGGGEEGGGGGGDGDDGAGGKRENGGEFGGGGDGSCFDLWRWQRKK